MTRLTMKGLDAMSNALNAILAGEEGEGDAGDIPFADYEAALDWTRGEKDRRARRKNLRASRWRDRADAAAQFAADKERYFPEPPEYLG